MIAGPKPTPPKWVRSRKLYEGEPLTLAEIAEIEGISVQALHLRRQACGWFPRRPGRGGRNARSGHDATEDAAGSNGGRPAILLRLWSLLERQVGDLASGGTAQELASLTRTLEKLIETERDLKDGGAPADEGPEDFDEFRDEIARRLEGLLGAGTDR